MRQLVRAPRARDIHVDETDIDIDIDIDIAIDIALTLVQARATDRNSDILIRPRLRLHPTWAGAHPKRASHHVSSFLKHRPQCLERTRSQYPCGRDGEIALVPVRLQRIEYDAAAATPV